jgi:hypothetical protein
MVISTVVDGVAGGPSIREGIESREVSKTDRSA